METKELFAKPLAELRQIATDLDVNRAKWLKKEALVLEIQRADAELNGREVRGGILEIMSEGIGFLRSANYVSGPDDIYVSQSQIRRFDLRSGDLVIGHVRPPRNSERHYGLLKAESVNGMEPKKAKRRPEFRSLIPIFPDERFDLETSPHITSTRLINLIPCGYGSAWIDRFSTKSRKNHYIERNDQCNFG